MELRLMEAKHEANRTKEETERQAELEREVSNALHKSFIIIIQARRLLFGNIVQLTHHNNCRYSDTYYL